MIKLSAAEFVIASSVAFIESEESYNNHKIGSQTYNVLFLDDVD
jgi:hypothetical protein